MQNEKIEYLFKVLVIGDLGTGKTAIIKQYVHKIFSDSYRSTLGVDFALKVISFKDNATIRLQLWDIGGQERFGAMTRVYYKEAVGCLIVYDVTKHATFEAVEKWKIDLDEKVHLSDGTPIPCILLANKCDQQNDFQNGTKVQPDMVEYCKDNGYLACFETSAKYNINIEESIHFLVDKILEKQKKMTRPKQSTDIIRPTGLEGKARVVTNSCCS